MTTALAASYAPQWFLDFWLHITIISTKGIGFLFGISVTNVADIMTVNGFAMRIITQCTALHYAIILSAAILLYTRHALSYRLTGLLICVPFIVIANAFRLIVTGMVGSVSWDAFVIVHDYLWVAAFSMLILGIWIVWAEKRFILTRAAIKHVLMVLITCTAVYGGLLFAMPIYGSFMALTTSLIFKTLVSDPLAGITFTGERMFFRYAGGTFTANFAPELMAVALYIGLILSARCYGKEAIKRGILGLVIIVCLCTVVIAGGGAIVVTFGANVALVFLWTAHGVLLQLTLLWWMLQGRPSRLMSKKHPQCFRENTRGASGNFP